MFFLFASRMIFSISFLVVFFGMCIVVLIPSVMAFWQDSCMESCCFQCVPRGASIASGASDVFLAVMVNRLRRLCASVIACGVS